MSTTILVTLCLMLAFLLIVAICIAIGLWLIVHEVEDCVKAIIKERLK